MITVRFVIAGQPSDIPAEDRVFANHIMTISPLPGELITLAGEEFVVVDRKWVIENNSDVFITLRIRPLAERRVQ